MEPCSHVFVVTSWGVNSHSRSAKEMMCQKCLCTAQHETLLHLRKNHNLKIKVVPPKADEPVT